MSNEEKDLLLKDLCARLPYGVKIEYLYWDEGKCEEYPVPMAVYSVNADGYMELIGDVDEGGGHIEIDKYLPYLRPMSSITDEEFDELSDLVITTGRKNGAVVEECNVPKVMKFYNSHYFDYRGLIPMGLALEAPEKMYNTKTNNYGTILIKKIS